MKITKENNQSTNTSLVSICSLASQDNECIDKGILSLQYNFDECEYIGGGILEDEYDEPELNQLQNTFDQNGRYKIKQEKQGKSQQKYEFSLTDMLDFPIFLTDVQLDNSGKIIENQLYLCSYNAPKEWPFSQLEDQCIFKKEYSQYNINGLELQIKEPSEKIEQSQNDDQMIDSELDFNGNNRKIKKNVNMPKAITRYLMKNYQHYEHSLFKEHKELFTKLSKDVKQFKNWKRKDKNNCFKLKHLNYFFSNPQQRKLSCLNRLMMRKILSRSMRKEIVPSNQVKDKLEYLVASKVYSIRCANPQLAERMQMR